MEPAMALPILSTEIPRQAPCAMKPGIAATRLRRRSPQRLLLPQNAGAKLRIVAADSRYKLLEAPAPIRSQPAEIAKAATVAAAIEPPEEKKGSWRSLITWIIVCVALAGFVAWKRLSS